MRKHATTAVLIIALCSDPIQSIDLNASQTKELTFYNGANFGQIHVLGSTGIGPVRVTNRGTEPVTITEATFTGPSEFVVIVEPQLPKTIQPGNFILWNFRYFPETAGPQTADLIITSDATGSPHTVTISAEAVDTPLGPWDWEFVGRPMENRDVNAILVHPEDDDLWYVAAHGGLCVTRDGGASWELHLEGGAIHHQALFIDPTNTMRIYACSNDGLYVSTDYGVSWDLLPAFTAQPAAVRSLVVSSTDGTIYIPHPIDDVGNTMNPGLYRSTDLGATWEFFSFGIVEDNIIPWDIEHDPVTGNLYVATEIGDHPPPYDPPFFRSLDNGETWEEVSGVLPWHGLKIQVDPSNQDVYFLTEGAGLFKSTDHASNWEFLSNFFYMDLRLDENHANRQYGGAHTWGSWDGGSFMSEDGGLSFKMIGLEDLIISSLTLNSTGTTLYAASYGAGIFKTPVPSPTPVIEPDGLSIPEKYSLGQNYPNPFNSTTVIAFDLPHACELTLKVFDLMGHEVAELASGDHQAGRFKITWDVSGMPNGIYFYRLQAETYSATKRLILMK